MCGPVGQTPLIPPIFLQKNCYLFRKDIDMWVSGPNFKTLLFWKHKNPIISNVWASGPNIFETNLSSRHKIGVKLLMFELERILMCGQWAKLFWYQLFSFKNAICEERILMCGPVGQTLLRATFFPKKDCLTFTVYQGASQKECYA